MSDYQLQINLSAMYFYGGTQKEIVKRFNKWLKNAQVRELRAITFEWDGENGAEMMTVIYEP